MDILMDIGDEEELGPLPIELAHAPRYASPAVTTSIVPFVDKNINIAVPTPIPIPEKEQVQQSSSSSCIEAQAHVVVVNDDEAEDYEDVEDDDEDEVSTRADVLTGEIHILSMHVKVYHCNICARNDFTSEELFKQHFRIDHKINIGSDYQYSTPLVTEYGNDKFDVEKELDRFEKHRGSPIPGRKRFENNNEEDPEWVDVEESDNEDNYDSSDDEHELDMEKFLALCNEEDDQTDDNTDDDPEYRVDEESEIDSDEERFKKRYRYYARNSKKAEKESQTSQQINQTPTINPLPPPPQLHSSQMIRPQTPHTNGMNRLKPPLIPCPRLLNPGSNGIHRLKRPQLTPSPNMLRIRAPQKTYTSRQRLNCLAPRVISSGSNRLVAPGPALPNVRLVAPRSMAPTPAASKGLKTVLPVQETIPPRPKGVKIVKSVPSDSITPSSKSKTIVAPAPIPSNARTRPSTPQNLSESLHIPSDLTPLDSRLNQPIIAPISPDSVPISQEDIPESTENSIVSSLNPTNSLSLTLPEDKISPISNPLDWRLVPGDLASSPGSRSLSPSSISTESTSIHPNLFSPGSVQWSLARIEEITQSLSEFTCQENESSSTSTLVPLALAPILEPASSSVTLSSEWSDIPESSTLQLPPSSSSETSSTVQPSLSSSSFQKRVKRRPFLKTRIRASARLSNGKTNSNSSNSSNQHQIQIRARLKPSPLLHPFILLPHSRSIGSRPESESSLGSSAQSLKSTDENFQDANCSFCCKTFNYMSALDTHMVFQHWHDDAATPQCICAFCEKIFDNVHGLYLHLKNNLSEETCEYGFSVEFPVKCGVCEKGFFNAECFSYHLKSEHNLDPTKFHVKAPYRCTICNLDQLLMDSLFKHVIASHGVSKPKDRHNVKLREPMITFPSSSLSLSLCAEQLAKCSSSTIIDVIDLSD